MTRRYRDNDEDVALIELTPMIDVVFLLLIFFMVSARIFDPHGYDVELPETDAAPQQSGVSESLIVAIDAAGDAVIDGRRYTAGEALELGSEVREIVIRADRDASHGNVMYWMDRLQQAGVRSVTLASVPKLGERR